jgi:AraC family transcriptional regulator
VIHDSFDNPTLSVGILARELRVHPVHLAREFRKELKTSPSDYIKSHRCARAAEMLRTGRDSLAAIAVDCGFSDQSSFTRTFRRYHCATPGEFRRACGRSPAVA